jgi:signal transduction histidine kinase
MSPEENREPSSESCDEVSNVLQAVEDTLLNGSIPENPFIPGDTEIQQKLEKILADIVATQQFALAMAQGDLSQDLIVKGHMAGSLKALQSNLRHLTWQAGQIAGGDLSQRVHFMGDFSASFNAMVEHLAEDEINRNAREEELRRVNAALSGEVAERKKVEGALLQAHKKITMLSSITRHDIKNQLVSLRGYLAISERIIKDPKLLEFIRKGDCAAAAIESQIKFTKYYEDIGVNAPDWQDIQGLIQMARSQLPLPGKIEVTAEVPPVKVFADGLIGKVFYNLMENTLRHGGEVSRIRFSFTETDRGAEILYEDNGVGISPEDKTHLFERGFGKNTGLGLFLSQEILAITGLTMQETGEPGKGVRFKITVPKEGYRFRD